MKVVHLVAHNDGGAGKAAIRLNEALNRNNINSKLLTINYSNSNLKIGSLVNNNFKNILYKIYKKINNKILSFGKFKEYFSLDLLGINLMKNKEIRDADIIHLHWVNDAMVSYSFLKKMSKLNKKIVWTMHDMNTFTGGCHYSGNCEEYKEECKRCPYGSSMLTNIIWKQKKKSINKLYVTILGCSKWITECAKESTILKNKICLNVPNCIDTNKYVMIDRDVARKKLGICEDKKIILFGAMSADSDKRKGFKELKEALSFLPKDEYQCYVFGTESIQDLSVDVKSLGYIKEEERLVLAYNAADVFVAPSLQENLANTVMESIACGTPVVAFNIGGMSDMIKKKVTGKLVTPYNTKELAESIISCAQNSEMFRDSCRKYVEHNYSYKSVGEKIIEVYNK